MLDSNYKNIAIFGYSGHAYVVVDALLENNCSVIGYFEQQQQINNPYNLTYLGQEDEMSLQALEPNTIVFSCIGSNFIRKKMVELFEKNNLNQVVIQHPRSIVSKSAIVKTSTFISAGAIVNAFVKIGAGCIINSGAIVEHECEIGDFSHIAPGAVLAGNVTIGEESFIGANTIVKQGLKIGNKVVIGAGSVVLKNVPDNETWVGNPAKRIK